jgi:hypothetical protein
MVGIVWRIGSETDLQGALKLKDRDVYCIKTSNVTGCTWGGYKITGQMSEHFY